jgi:hypothetical protein
MKREDLYLKCHTAMLKDGHAIQIFTLLEEKKK